MRPLSLCIFLLLSPMLLAQIGEPWPAIVVGKVLKVDKSKRSIVIESDKTGKESTLKFPFGARCFVDDEEVDFEDFKAGQEKVAAYYSEKTDRIVSLRRHVSTDPPKEATSEERMAEQKQAGPQKPGHLGIVDSVDLKNRVLKYKNAGGQILSFPFGPTIKVQIDGKAAKPADLKKGMTLLQAGSALIKAETPTPIDPKPAPKAADPAKPDAEKEAARKLKLAKTFLEPPSPDKATAKKRLKEIVDKYPGTKAAVEARELLAGLANQ